MSATVSPPKARRGALAWIIPLVGLLIALGLGYGALDIVLDHRSMARNAIPTEGRMTGGYRQVTSGRSRSTSYYPTFSYWTADRRVVLGTVSDEMDQSDIRAGRTLPLRYDPQDPTKVRLASALEGGPGVLPWILGGLAILMAAISVIPLVTGRRVKV
ncbi:DUF3592 domain-containing protein [Muricoccus radiodurans]|uniref:DUF3592 domain-containing protein n=1 Tax=Muricoccus radiodurans TaxID=2231721 RepID=UPI003CF221C4